jgi:ribosome-associated protein
MAQTLPDISSELTFTTSRSSGPGGQNVNKVETKVEVRFDINASTLLTYYQRKKLLNKLANKLSQDSIIIVSSQEKRSQVQNKNNAIEKLYALLNEALHERADRKATRPTKASVDNRIKTKKIESEFKKFRGNLAGKIKE